MKTFTEPEILTDKTRFQEIFDLRVYAWEKSPSPANINRETYPNGFFDELDETAVHWVSLNTDGKIIAAARLAIIYDINELPYPQIFVNVELPAERPFLFYSRLVIHPEYRKWGLKEKFDLFRLRYQVENKFAFSVATASQTRTKELLKYGWQDCADVTDVKGYSFPFGKERSLLLLLLLLLLGDVKLPLQISGKVADNSNSIAEFQNPEFKPEIVMLNDSEKKQNVI